MKRFLRPAFVITGCVALVGCPEPPTTPPDDGTTRNPPEPAATETATATASATVTATAATTATATTSKIGKRVDVHPRDAAKNLIQRKADGTCYVQVAKKGPPPKDLMSGERWVEDKTVKCPKEYDEPAFAAIPLGKVWIQDDQTGECFHEPLYGNPPPPPKKAECPPSLEKKK